jgi:hypothetical protein
MAKKLPLGLLLLASLLAVAWPVEAISQSAEEPRKQLKARAAAWAELVIKVDAGGLEREDAIPRIASFLEPSALRRARAEEMYEMFLDPNIPDYIAASIEDIELLGDGKAEVRISTVSRLRGKKTTQSNLTGWRQVQGEWYRIIKAPTVTEGS